MWIFELSRNRPRLFVLSKQFKCWSAGISNLSRSGFRKPFCDGFTGLFCWLQKQRKHRYRDPARKQLCACFSAYNATMNNLYNSGKTQCCHGSGEDQYSHAQRYMRGYIYVTGSCSGYGSSAPTWQVCICHYHTEGGYTHHYRLAVVADSTAQVTPSPCLDLNPDRLAANTEGPWITVKNNASGASRSMNIAFGLYSNDGRGGNSYGECIRVYQRFYNSYGTTSWVSNSFNLGS